MEQFPNFDKRPDAVAIDLDGTLLDSQTRLSTRNRLALEACLAKGIPVIIATSRAARIFNRIFPRDLAEACSMVVMNGAITVGRPPFRGYFKEPLPDGMARAITAFATTICPGVSVTLEIDGYEFGANWTTDPATLLQRNSATPEMVLSIDQALERRPCKIALSALGSDTMYLAEKLTAEFGHGISIVPALLGSPMLNVTGLQASKPSGLRKLVTPRGASLEGILAFGDDSPDIGMLTECGMSVAVGNAFAEVKTVCKYHTASNDEDGVALVLEHMLAQLE